MFRIPHWCRWFLGSVTLLTMVCAALLIPAVQQARNAAKKSRDR